jgi:hypothetical protein
MQAPLPLKELYEAQVALNAKTLPAFLPCGAAKKVFIDARDQSIRLPVDFKQAMQRELDELAVVLPFGHWKDTAKQMRAISFNDFQNLLLELVDIFHFLMSENLVEVASVCNDGQPDLDVIVKHSVARHTEALLFLAPRDPSITTFADVWHKVNENGQMNIGDFCTLANLNTEVSSFSARLAPGATLESERVIYNFHTLLSMFGFSNDDLLTVYRGKGVLNEFRQCNGYRDGSYIKQWKGAGTSTIEDNVVMLGMISRSIPAFLPDGVEPYDFSPGELFMMLDAEYKAMKAVLESKSRTFKTSDAHS